MTLSLDTNVVIEIVRDRSPSIRRGFGRALLAETPMVASLIVFHELRYGVSLSARPAIERRAVDTVLDHVVVEPFDILDMEAAAGLRARLRRAGQSIGPYDTLIAGQALARGWTVVTENRREFDRVDGLTVIDWTEPQD